MAICWRRIGACMEGQSAIRVQRIGLATVGLCNAYPTGADRFRALLQGANRRRQPRRLTRTMTGRWEGPALVGADMAGAGFTSCAARVDVG